MNIVTINGPRVADAVEAYIERFRLDATVVRHSAHLVVVSGPAARAVGVAFADVGWTVDRNP